MVGTFLPGKHVIPYLIAGGGGRIVNLAGTSGLRGYRNHSGYSSSKWAIRGLTRTLALELGPHDITVNAVCPNVTNGDRMDRIASRLELHCGLLHSWEQAMTESTKPAAAATIEQCTIASFPESKKQLGENVRESLRGLSRAPGCFRLRIGSMSLATSGE